MGEVTYLNCEEDSPGIPAAKRHQYSNLSKHKHQLWTYVCDEKFVAHVVYGFDTVEPYRPPHFSFNTSFTNRRGGDLWGEPVKQAMFSLNRKTDLVKDLSPFDGMNSNGDITHYMGNSWFHFECMLRRATLPDYALRKGEVTTLDTVIKSIHPILGNEREQVLEFIGREYLNNPVTKEEWNEWLAERLELIRPLFYERMKKYDIDVPAIHEEHLQLNSQMKQWIEDRTLWLSIMETVHNVTFTLPKHGLIYSKTNWVKVNVPIYGRTDHKGDRLVMTFDMAIDKYRDEEWLENYLVNLKTDYQRRYGQKEGETDG